MAATNVQAFSGDVEVASNLAVDTNTLFVDSETNRVGIGTTIPQNTLAAVGNVTFGAGASTTDAAYHSGMLNVIGGGTRALLRIENNTSVGSPGIIFGEGGTFTEDTVPTIKKVQGTNNLAIITSGNVGVGTDSPAESLEVSGNYRAGRTTGGYTFGVDNGGSVQAGVYSDANNGLIFKAGNDSEKMRILNDGNVGIGTDSPAQSLHVSKVAAGGVNSILVSNPNGDADSSAALKLGVSSEDDTVAKFGIIHERKATYGRGDTYFCTNYADDTTDVSESDVAMTILGSNKYVGIGVTNPGIILDVGSSLSNPEIGRNYAVGVRPRRR
jgi:hypothetical protein